MRTILFLLTISVIVLLSACIPKECQFPAAYEFEIPVSFFPSKDTFHIGDTISISSVFSDKVYERKTDKWYALENFRFYPEMIIREISGSTSDEAAILKFEITIDEAFDFSQIIYTDGGVSYIGEYTYSYDEKKYFLEYKFIPKETGLFLFSHPLLISKLGEEQNFDGICSNKSVSAIVNLNEGSDNNIELLRESPIEKYNTQVFENPDKWFHENGSFAFVVVE